MTTATLFVLLLILMFFNVPLFASLSGAVLVTFALFSDVPLTIIIQRMFSGVDKWALMAIPFFVLAANLMSRGGMSERIIRLANVIVGWFPGGLGLTVIAASMFFGAISGSAPATVVAVGALLFPALLKEKYGKEYSAGVITASGALGVIIPPSVTMIVYGAVTGASVGTLFIAGFGAGLLFGLVFMVYTYFFAKKKPDINLQPKPTTKEVLQAFKDSAWGIGVPVIIIGGIYGGIFTPTESAAVAVVYALFVSIFIYRQMSLKDLYATLTDSAVTTSQVMIVLSAASVFAWILTSEGITVAIAESVLSIASSQWSVLLCFNVILLIAGMFMDGAAIITILAPLLLPIALQVGIDPIHLGVVMVVNTALGMFTPPFGLNLFVASSITDMSIVRLSKAVLPFMLLSLITVLLVTYVPDISLWLPRQVYGAW
jgi:C4-dicarboxylate transporter DctM subunit